VSGAEPRLLIVSGLSGAGKTVALHALEDLGFYCIDNLPIDLLPAFSAQIRSQVQPLYEQVAVGIDARNPADSLSLFPQILQHMRTLGLTPELLYIEADDDTLLQRFSETRRKHPLKNVGTSLREALQRERALLAPIAEQADLRINTSGTFIHALRDQIRIRVAGRKPGQLALQFMSFGYKYGLPSEADFVFDVRCLPNPHWEPRLRDYTGQDRPVIDYLQGQAMVGQMLTDLKGFLEGWLPSFEAENRSYLTIAIGCTGGHHRSVFIVEQLAGHFSSMGKSVLVNHRDMQA